MDYKGLYYGQYRYPSWAEGIGWLIVSLLIGFIPFVAAWKFFKCVNSFQVTKIADDILITHKFQFSGVF